MPSRFPRWVYDHGDEPDARFTLANERTFLAWTRTALAVIAGGVALEAVTLPLEPTLRHVAALVLLLLGLAIPLLAWFGWARAERAMREGRSLPSSPVSAVLAAGVTVVAVLLTIGALIR
jgi:inner membrane protein YidH